MTIKTIKPWVQFGISPFGVWRNQTDDLRGLEHTPVKPIMIICMLMCSLDEKRLARLCSSTSLLAHWA